MFLRLLIILKASAKKRAAKEAKTEVFFFHLSALPRSKSYRKKKNIIEFAARTEQQIPAVTVFRPISQVNSSVIEVRLTWFVFVIRWADSL